MAPVADLTPVIEWLCFDVLVPLDIRADHRLLLAVRRVHEEIRDGVRAAMAARSAEELADPDDTMTGDTIYAIDRVGERALLDGVARHLAPWLPLVVVAEGLADTGHGEGVALLPATARAADAALQVVIDPIDGTRGLMYAKRSAWILTGVAPRQLGSDEPPRLAAVQLAVQTEIPPPKQGLADVLWAVRGGGAHATRVDLSTGAETPFALRPSAATSLEHGFGQVMRAFPGGRDILAAIDDEICAGTVSERSARKALTFEDQYISTGGQLAELAYGHDRWVADLRPLLAVRLAERGEPPLLCCHPYDICTALIAEEAGVLLRDERGGIVNPPLSVDADVTWVGYANAGIAARVQPVLQRAAAKHGLLE